MPLYGADVSGFQQGFDFNTNAGTCGFVMVKQTEGLNWPDSNPTNTQTAQDMREAAQHAGYEYIGLYHFARPQHGRTGSQEAEHFIAFVRDLYPNEGVILDFEHNSGLNGEELEDFAISFVDTIEAKWPTLKGCVLLYSYPNFLANMSTDRLVERCPLWIAAYGHNDGTENPGALELDRWASYTFWQFTSTGNMPGWAGRLDINRFEGHDTDLCKLSVGNTQVFVPPAPQPPTTEQPAFVPEAWPGTYLRRGSSGNDVVQIQQRLKRRGWNIDVDGEFGRATDTVIRKFQAEKGLTVDGIVGRSTWDAMYAFFEGLDVMPPPVVVIPPLPPPPDNTGGELLHPDPVGQCAAWGFDGNCGLDPVTEFQRAFGWWALEVDGIAGTKTARAVQKVVENDGKLSEHFDIDELKCKHCGRIRFLRQTLESMELVRAEYGPLPVISGYRCPEHNANIGGAPNGQHPMGAACDFNVPVELAEMARFSGIGTCGRRCLHGDRRDASGNNSTGSTQSNPARWPYC